MTNFTYLFYFTTPKVDIAEIKRLGPEFVTPAQTYKWLWINKETQKIQVLQFQSMDRTEAQEFRTFSEGKFEFNQQMGLFKSADGDLNLERTAIELVPEQVNRLIKELLSGCN